jgi:hypothetical protein
MAPIVGGEDAGRTSPIARQQARIDDISRQIEGLRVEHARATRELAGTRALVVQAHCLRTMADLLRLRKDAEHTLAALQREESR